MASTKKCLQIGGVRRGRIKTLSWRRHSMPTQRLDIGRSALRTRNHLIISVQNYCDIKKVKKQENVHGAV